MGANARARGAYLLTDGDLNTVENYIEPLEDSKKILLKNAPTKWNLL